jgi:PQQ-dependent catabolism-associated CXXCW motif protein
MTGPSLTKHGRQGSGASSRPRRREIWALNNSAFILIFASSVLCTASAFSETSVAEPSSYRQDHYRGPVPETLNGAPGLALEEARKLWEAGNAVFIDVIAHVPRPKNLKEGTIWRDLGREDIPHSVWLPDTGYGALAPQTEVYFRDGLEAATGGDMDKAIVIYCRDECWMSWNAAKRAENLGYTHVLWFPGGTDAWSSAGLPLEERQPFQGGPED